MKIELWDINRLIPYPQNPRKNDEAVGAVAKSIQEVTAVRYCSLIHDWGLLNAISEVPAVRESLRQVSESLKTHLTRT